MSPTNMSASGHDDMRNDMVLKHIIYIGFR